MHNNEPLGDRQSQILVAIVREFIRSADPVGSKHLVGRFNLAVSSATVRNDMARLEELGYLAQPHTSAGRVPTDLGYRFFVDHESPAKVGASQRREIEAGMSSGPADLDELLHRANEILSRQTNLAVASLTPRLRESRLKHLDLAWVSPRRAVLVVIADGGRVEKCVVELEQDITEEDLERIEGTLNRTLTAKSFSDAVAFARDEIAPERPDAALHAVARAVAGSLDAFLEQDQDVIVGGAAKLAHSDALMQPGFARVFEVFEKRAPLQQAFADAESPASVRIGSEVPVEDLHSCSVVVAPYSQNAAIGVIGPTRMEYPKIIAVVSLMAQLLGDQVQELD